MWDFFIGVFVGIVVCILAKWLLGEDSKERDIQKEVGL